MARPAVSARSAARKAREATEVRARYDAAGMGRRAASWTPPGSGPNVALQGLQNIRNRARDTARNDWAGESGISKWVSNLVGVGITPHHANEAHGALWATWTTEADADGVLDYYGMQALGTRAWLDSGEVFLRRRPRSLLAPLSVPLQLQLIEADFCPLFDAAQWDGMPAGNFIRQGIEFNQYGRRVAYWFYKEHPGDKPLSGRSVDPLSLVRVLARDVRHVFEPKRPGQLRGVPLLAPVLMRLRASMDYEDAVLDRQKLANLFTMFITRTMPSDWSGESDPLTGLPLWYSGDKPLDAW